MGVKASGGVRTREEALARAKAEGLDLFEIAATANPPVVRIMDFGKFKYLEEKKARQAKAKAKGGEMKTVQVKIATGEHDLELKARKAAEFLRDGHRVKVDLYLSGRAKYLDKAFLKTRLERLLHMIPEEYSMGEISKGPKGMTVVIEKKK